MKRVLVALVVGSLALPLVTADETKADCEEGQMWIGYATTERGREAYGAAGRPAELEVCEGEQWDGQNSVDPDAEGADPNEPGPPAAASVGSGEAYSQARVPFLARLGVYAGYCRAGDAGLEGDAACADGGEARAGVYAGDETPLNLWFSALGVIGIFRGYVTDGDCDQRTYSDPDLIARPICGRDNTAVGVHLGLP